MSSYPEFRPLHGGVRMVCLLGLVLALLGLTTVLAAVIAGWVSGRDIFSTANLLVGLMCSLVFWLFAAVFHLRRETVTMSAVDAGPFLSQARGVLEELGYEVYGDKQSLNAWPRFHALLLGGKVDVRLAQGQAAIRGPRLMTEVLRRRLRFQGHLERARRDMEVGRKPAGDMLYKRVHVQVRLTPECWTEFASHVLARLQAEGQVAAEVSLLVQSDRGVHERALEEAVAWLEEQGMAPEVRREFIQRQEPSGVFS